MKRIAFLTSVLWAHGAIAAEPACPDWAGPDKPILEYSYQFRGYKDGEPKIPGPRLDAPSWYWTQGVWFKMAFGYRNPWPKGDFAAIATDKARYREWLATNSYKGFDPKTGKYEPSLVTGTGNDGIFEFWMPDLRPVERDAWYSPDWRACEAGREKPSEDTFRVRVNIDWPFLPGFENSDVSIRFRNAEADLKAGRPLVEQTFKREEHNLNGPITGSKYYGLYGDDGDVVVRGSCTPYAGLDRSQNPTCRLWVWERSSNLSVLVVFPSDKGQYGTEPRWKGPVKAAIKLAKEWRKNGIEE